MCRYCGADQSEDAWARAAASVAEPGSRRERSDLSPVAIIVNGFLMAVGTGVLAAVMGLDTTGGVIVAVVGGVVSQVVLLVGVIAKGVEIGNRASR